jgi:hypothetical protein
VLFFEKSQQHVLALSINGGLIGALAVAALYVIGVS